MKNLYVVCDKTDDRIQGYEVITANDGTEVLGEYALQGNKNSTRCY